MNCLSKTLICSVIVLVFSCNEKTYEIEKINKSSEDLAYYLVKDNASNLEYKVYFDERSETAAAQSISHLNIIYKGLLEQFITKGAKIEWADVAFVNDTTYKTPMNAERTRWIIQNKGGKLSKDSEDRIYYLITHEQVHSWQKQFQKCENIPRWFKEGIAVWAEYKVTKKLRPLVYENSINLIKEDYNKVIEEDDDLNLSSWGGISVKPEAIRRQLTPEGQKYFDETGRTPKGATFSISPADMMEDNVNQGARYYSSLLLMKELENELGYEQFKNWVYKIASSEFCENEKIIKDLKQHNNIDLLSKL